MEFYKATFPESSIFPKLHILECHVVDWLRKWRVGFGMMGEQGAESIHRYFNGLKRTFSSIPDGVQQLNCLMKEHYVHVAPANIAQEPVPKKRKTDT